MNILIVEDDPDSRLMMQDLLESAQHRVICVSNGAQALKWVRKEQPELIISDLMMPEMDGFELLYSLQHDNLLRHIPVIICTATYVDSADEHLALELGAEHFMLKPIEPQQLLNIVAELESSAHTQRSPENKARQRGIKREEFLQTRLPRVSEKLHKKTGELELYKKIYCHSRDLICILNPSGMVLQANPAFCNFFSCSGEQLHHLNLFAYLHEPIRNDLLHNVLNKLPFQADTTAWNFKGDSTFLDISAHPFIDENAQVNSIVFQARINAEPCRHAEELEMLRQLIDISNDAVFVIKADDATFKYVNRSAHDHLGYSRTELLNLRVMDIVEEIPHIDEWHSHVGSMRKTTTPVFESTHICKDGTRLPVEVSVSYDESKSGIPLIWAVARDITERLHAREQQKKLEMKLNQARTMEALGTMAGGIAHDFNNIVGAVSGYTEMAQRHLNKPDKVQKCLTQVMRASQRARDLVGQILAFSSRENPRVSAVNLADIVKEVIELLRPNVAPGIKIEPVIATPCSAALADPGQMHQVIMNLCTNALHAMEGQERGEMRITLKDTTLNAAEAAQDFNLVPGAYVELKIHDTGSGIEEKARQRIFEPYFSTRKKSGGTGLGLALVHGIIKDFKGAISVESGVGEGSVFSVLLPAADKGKHADDGASVTKPESAPAFELNNTQARHLLVVDDEEQITALIKQVLESHKYKVTCTTSGRDALEIFENRATAFDMVITDYSMPDMDGIELAHRIHDIRSDIPVLLCSGYYADKDPGNVSEAGIAMVLRKPLQDYQLTLAIDNILNT